MLVFNKRVSKLTYDPHNATNSTKQKLVSPIIILYLCYWDSDQFVQKRHCFWVKTIIVLCTCTNVIEIQSTAVRVKLQGFGYEHAQVQLGKFELEL